MSALLSKSSLVYLLFLVSIFGFFPFHTDGTVWAKLSLQWGVIILMLASRWNHLQSDRNFWTVGIYGCMFLVTLIPALIQADSALEGWSFLTRYAFIVVAWVALGLSTNSRTDRFDLATKVMAMVLLIICGWGAFEWAMALDGFTLTHKATYAVTANMAHRNLFIQYALVVLPLVALVKSENSILRLIKNLSISICILLAVLLLNRMAWITLIVFAIVTVVVQNRFGVIGSSKWTRLKKLSGVAFIVALGLGFFVIDELYTFWHQFEMSFDFEKSTTRDRVLLQWRTLGIAFSSWIWGHGFDTWKVLIMQFPQDRMLTEAGTLFYQRPHNDYLWLFAEGGFIPALAYLGLHLVGIAKSYSRIRNEGVKAFALHLSWIGLFIASFSNFPMERPEFLLIIALLCALTFDPPRQNRISRSSKYLLLLIAAIVGSTLVWRSMAEWHYFNARQAQAEQQYSEASFSINEAMGLGLVKDSYSMPLDWLAGFYQQQDQGACDNFQSAYMRNPYHPDVLNSLGICSVNKGNAADGLSYFYESVSRTPRYLQGWFNIALIRNQQGDWRSAFVAYLNADPTNSNDAFEQLGVKLAIDSLNQMIPKLPERKMYLTVEAIRNTPHWALDLMKKSSLNNIPFSDQVYIDACYYMKNTCDEYDDCDLANSLIEKYLPAGVTDLDEIMKSVE